jgi:hypothetical protein
MLAAAICLASVPFASAWSSKDYPMFEPVHQMAIANVLKGNFSAAEIKVLQDQQLRVDEDQKASQSFEHSMTGLEKGQTIQDQKPLFIARTEEFVRTHLAAAISARKAGSTADALPHLGQAIHPLQDATSPAHRGFQSWSSDESWFAMAQHVAKERVYPDDSDDKEQVAERKALEGAVRWAYDIYMERAPLPDHFFDSDGNLLLPASYIQ